MRRKQARLPHPIHGQMTSPYCLYKVTPDKEKRPDYITSHVYTYVFFCKEGSTSHPKVLVSFCSCHLQYVVCSCLVTVSYVRVHSRVEPDHVRCWRLDPSCWMLMWILFKLCDRVVLGHVGFAQSSRSPNFGGVMF